MGRRGEITTVVELSDRERRELLAGAKNSLGAAELVAGMVTQMRSMSEMLRITNERMSALEEQVRTLEKVTPRQITTLNAAIRDRSAAVCREYRMAGSEKAVNAAIRRTIRNLTGAATMREIARCDVAAVTDCIREWDEFGTIRKIREKVKRG